MLSNLILPTILKQPLRTSLPSLLNHFLVVILSLGVGGGRPSESAAPKSVLIAPDEFTVAPDASSNHDNPSWVAVGRPSELAAVHLALFALDESIVSTEHDRPVNSTG